MACSGSASPLSRARFAVGVYLTLRGGWPILAFALLGGMAAIFYVAPPIRWAYRGLGELVIALSYGPWMVLGSLYLHTRGAVGGGAVRVAGAGIPDHGARRRQCDSRLSPGPARRQAQPRRASRPPARRSALSRARGGGPAGGGRRRGRGRLPARRASPRCWRCRCSSRADAARCARTNRRANSFPAVRSIVSCYMVAVLLFTAGLLWPIHG